MSPGENRLWRWPLFAMGVTALFWGIWYQFAPVPSELAIKLPGCQLQLQVLLSRWWDIVAIGVWALAVALISIRITKDYDGDMYTALCAGIITGLITSPCSIPSADYPISLLVFISVLGLVIVFHLNKIHPNLSLAFGLGFGLGFCLIYSLIVGLIVGLILSLILRLTFYLNPHLKSFAEWLDGK